MSEQHDHCSTGCVLCVYEYWEEAYGVQAVRAGVLCGPYRRWGQPKHKATNWTWAGDLELGL